MKTYAPKSLRGSDLRDLLDQLVATPAQVAKFLDVTERSVFRWLSDGTAPRAVLFALWHETPHGREVSALDVGNELAITRRVARGAQEAQAVQVQQLARLLAISDTGAANDPLLVGPFSVVHAVTRPQVDHQNQHFFTVNAENYPVRAHAQPVPAFQVVHQGLGQNGWVRQGLQLQQFGFHASLGVPVKFLKGFGGAGVKG